MPSKTKEARIDQKERWESELNRRLTFLSESGTESDKIVKDAAVRKIRAKLRETNARLDRISALKGKLEKMAESKAAKAAAPKEKKGKKKEEQAKTPEMSKRQQKKQKKKQQSEG